MGTLNRSSTCFLTFWSVNSLSFGYLAILTAGNKKDFSAIQLIWTQLNYNGSLQTRCSRPVSLDRHRQCLSIRSTESRTRKEVHSWRKKICSISSDCGTQK